MIAMVVVAAVIVVVQSLEYDVTPWLGHAAAAGTAGTRVQHSVIRNSSSSRRSGNKSRKIRRVMMILPDDSSPTCIATTNTSTNNTGTDRGWIQRVVVVGIS
jgi:hypothetical protein